MRDVMLNLAFLLCAALLTLLAGIGLSHAQPISNTGIPGAGQLAPGQLEREHRRDVLTPVVTREPQALFPALIPTPMRPEPEMLDGRRGRVERIEVRDVTRLSAAQIEAVTRSAIGKTLSARELKTLASEITALYVRAGYLLSEVYVPDQDLRAGVVRLLAVEGRIAQVIFNASDRPVGNDSVLSGYAARILREKPITRATLERNLLLMNEVGDTLAIPTLKASPDTPGAYDLHIEVGQKRWAGNLSISNRGNRWVGPVRIGGELYLNSDLFGGARTGLRVTTSANAELNLASLTHEQNLGASGTKLFLQGTTAKSRPDLVIGSGGSLDVRSSSASATIAVPIVRGREWNLAARAGVTTFRGDSRERVSATTLIDDRVNAARFGIGYDGTDTLRGVNLWDLESSFGSVRCGTSSAGAALCSRPLEAGDKNFAKLNVYLARLQSLGAGWSALLALSGQYSLDPLAVGEQFAFGGEQFGRAFDAAELLGDSGLGFKFELRRNGRIGEWPVTAYGFYDAGHVVRYATAAVGSVAASGRVSRDGQAIGLGLRAQVKGGLAGYAEIAKPLGLDVASNGNRNVRLFGGLSYSF